MPLQLNGFVYTYQPVVPGSSTPSTLFSHYISLHCEKDENKQKEAGFGPFFKKYCPRLCFSPNLVTLKLTPRLQRAEKLLGVRILFPKFCLKHFSQASANSSASTASPSSAPTTPSVRPSTSRPGECCGLFRKIPIDISEKQTAHWPGPPASVDTSSYVVSCKRRYETHFGTVCEVIELICHWIQCQAAGLPTMTNEQSISLGCLWIYLQSVHCLELYGSTSQPSPFHDFYYNFIFNGHNILTI